MSASAQAANARRGWLSRRRVSSVEYTTLGLYLVALGIVTHIYAYISPSVSRLPPMELDLSGDWRMCVPVASFLGDCRWKDVKLPADFQASEERNFQGWIAYRKRFSAPAACLRNVTACSLFFGEIGDAAEVVLNGVSLGRRGEFPPTPRYAKLYPLSFDIPARALRPEPEANELTVIAYAMKHAQSGMRRGPIGILATTNAFKLSQSFVTVNVVVPILGFVGLLLLAILATLLGAIRQNQDAKYHSFIHYCFASSLFLLSFSEIPREYLPLGVAISLHFMARTLMDWAYFEMMREYFEYGPWTKRLIRPLYFIVVATFVGLAVVSAYGGRSISWSFDTSCAVMRAAFLLPWFPHLFGIFAAIRRWNDAEGKLCAGVFALLFCLQVHDTAIFHGFLVGTYAVKVYPFFLGLLFGFFFLERSRHSHAQMLLKAEQEKQMRHLYRTTLEIAHDLQTPLAGLAMACAELKRHRGNPAIIERLVSAFPAQLERTSQLTRSILEYSRELANEPYLHFEKTDLAAWLAPLLQSFAQSETARGISIDRSGPERKLYADIDRHQMVRVVQNLLANAAEACRDRREGRILVQMKSAAGGRYVTLTFSDNGCGIPEPIRSTLFEPFVSAEKPNGTGLGLAIAKRIIERHEGSITVDSSNSRGTTISVWLRSSWQQTGISANCD